MEVVTEVLRDPTTHRIDFQTLGEWFESSFWDEQYIRSNWDYYKGQKYGATMPLILKLPRLPKAIGRVKTRTGDRWSLVACPDGVNYDDGNEAARYCAGIIQVTDEECNRGRIMTIHQLYVNHDFRLKGVGHRLLEEVKIRLRSGYVVGESKGQRRLQVALGKYVNHPSLETYWRKYGFGMNENNDLSEPIDIDLFTGIGKWKLCATHEEWVEHIPNRETTMAMWRD